MKIDVTGHHVEITDSLRDYVNEKFQRLERHFDNVVDAHVILTVEKNRQCAEATLAVSGARLFAEADHEEMYAAIDLLIDKLDRQVVKHKEKRSDHHRGEGRVGPTLDS
ncbi:sigma 54 modulation protein / SSU 30S ribosomal protein S30P [Spiribacter salinus M19-40]|jgi:putative sigma-54 modulation protein|uniref:Ribosome hibernation promoting factor n=2 Tax=Spiribacter salinus TaxID=1335746 RepID=R4V6D8_9GAMM|nr:ribosome-associated translation inhibitor RaiA [Spiribacter salinus]MDR9413805.1 ribosome-associated translation inhibitor RaiA [Spiribacter sp.]AGM41494.1 sigma 54 modulation protein / SSU 30S ribosomal protein S30P [Spiribacter salinus M19-40]MBY5269084.1 ribosomal subunit interface protein [Spiribacter salinus]MDR9454672.1 ribosome-associated translation inhibitor RaiA [Spiribacter sp.]TQE98205.1 MAG: ribosome-associated translation inhibitor RaiA [Spiribacter salinus]